MKTFIFFVSMLGSINLIFMPMATRSMEVDLFADYQLFTNLPGADDELVEETEGFFSENQTMPPEIAEFKVIDSDVSVVHENPINSLIPYNDSTNRDQGIELSAQAKKISLAHVCACDLAYLHEKDLLSHIQNAHAANEQNWHYFSCPVTGCQRRTNTDQQLADHFEQKHPAEVTYICRDCFMDSVHYEALVNHTCPQKRSEQSTLVDKYKDHKQFSVEHRDETEATTKVVHAYKRVALSQMMNKQAREKKRKRAAASTLSTKKPKISGEVNTNKKLKIGANMCIHNARVV